MKGSTILQFLTFLVCVGLAYYAYQSSKEIELLHQENQILWEKLDSVQQAQKVAPGKKSTSGTATRSHSLWDTIAADLEKDYKESQQAAKKNAPKLAVSTSYRLEDRYVGYGGVEKPDFVGETEGVVVVDINVTRLGDVSTARINAATTIADEEVQEACKKAALKTNFNYISTAPDSQDGIITYTFKKK